MFIWKGGTSPFLVGIGVCTYVRFAKRRDGNYTFGVRYLTDPFEKKLPIEFLRRDRILRDANFLKIGPSGTLHPLTPKQGARLLDLVRQQGLVSSRFLQGHQAPGASCHHGGAGQSEAIATPADTKTSLAAAGPLTRQALLKARAGARLAAGVIAELWPDTQVRRVAARVMADSVRCAHAEAPASWSLTLFHKFVGLNVGQIAVLELFGDSMAVYSTTGVPNPGNGYHRVEHSYKAVSTPSERWLVGLDFLSTLAPELRRRHRELVQIAARAKRVSPFRRSHSPGAVKAIAHLAGEQLPEPEYPGSPTTRSPADEERIAAGGWYGNSELNKRVEQAAVTCVRKHSEAEGWVVHSVEDENRGYDLLLRRGGREQHVEVKGTRGAPDGFLMTRNELRTAQEDPRFVLTVVGHALTLTPSLSQWACEVFMKVFNLEPLQFQATRARN